MIRKCEERVRCSRDKPRVPLVAVSTEGEVGMVFEQRGRYYRRWCGVYSYQQAPESLKRGGAGARGNLLHIRRPGQAAGREERV